VAVSRSVLPILAFGSFFPYDMSLVGPAVDERSVKDYLARAAALTSAAGASVAALGSAWSRNVPPGWDRSRARAQLLEAYSWAADAFTGSGVTLAIEPQNRKETNIILSIEEAVGYAAQVDSPVLKVMADFYHMDEEGEPAGKPADVRGLDRSRPACRQRTEASWNGLVRLRHLLRLPQGGRLHGRRLDRDRRRDSGPRHEAQLRFLRRFLAAG
jgi:hypothetical protein